MSIDILCYAAASPAEVENVLARIVSTHGDLFPHCMTHPHVRSARDVHAVIAAEHGLLAPRSVFLISVNDKSQAYRVPELAEILRKAFNANAGDQRILILRDNEKPI